ncbi:carbonic anhydrase [Mytilinidion resinicola]|uniref:Carbonic anhydrase n=1 Tax=Mytilinidion resinicola TaxID=574789 RepID=A0A6A6Z237_9PEZI|nr:carbonic anhydrase [Mytilinidion resinicola]KAF2814779.1 carbonic anhydrase [Mytilinidion resinicola]
MLYSTFAGTLFFAASAYGSCLHATSHLHRRVEEGKVKVSTFGYTDMQGPLNWAGLAEENEACATSKVQSPINIDDTIDVAAEAPKITIASVNSAEFENLGTTVETIVNGTTTFNGTDFALKQFHFHTPSEHRINEEYFPLEMHMVHEAADGSGNIAVLAVLFQLSADGSTTDLLTSVTKNLEEIKTPGTITETGSLDFTALIEHLETTPLRQYTGSLTTPPCAEGLTFLVTQEPLALDVATFNAVKSVVKFNSRFSQGALGTENLLVVATANEKNIAARKQAGGGGEKATEPNPTEEAAPTKTGPTTILITEVAIGMLSVPTSVLAVAVNV